MSRETSAEGNSTESADGTLVLLTGMPCETRNELQNSLLLTPRLPIEGKPSGCRQEAADSIVMAGCTNRMVETTEPTKIADVNSEKAVLGGELAERACRVDEGDEMDVDIDRTVLLGGEPAERASGVDEGDGMERRDLWLQQTNLLCEETHQDNRNAEDNIPITNGLLLEGEWTVYPSGEMKNSNGGNAGREVKPVDSPNKLEALVTLSIELEGCKGGTDKPMELLTMSVELDVEDSSDIPRVYLGNRVDGLRGQLDTLSMSNRAVMTGLSHSDGTRMYLATGDAKHSVTEMDGARIHVDASSGCRDALSVETHVIKPENEMANVSIP